ncbi:hypothetical protein [Dietzia sp. 179-F 9C3 NHS]|uniref:hypothetical protein n=1 Tax=Dietzia sp. 179-F 9C3 NHS TaxID=3374295 RepID=UPI0038796A36
MTDDLDPLYAAAAEAHGLHIDDLKHFADDSTTAEGINARAAQIADAIDRAQAEQDADRADAITAQLAAVAALDATVNNTGDNLSVLLADLPVMPIIGALTAVAADILRNIDDDARADYLSAVRERIAAGHALPDHLKEDM